MLIHKTVISHVIWIVLKSAKICTLQVVTRTHNGLINEIPLRLLKLITFESYKPINEKQL